MNFTLKPRSRFVPALLLGALLFSSSSLPAYADLRPSAPSPVQPDMKANSPEGKAFLDKTLAIMRQLVVCKTFVNVKVSGASVDDVVAAIRKTMPEQKLAIEVRGQPQLSDTFDVKSTRVGDVLDHVASKAGSKFYVFDHSLVVSPPDKLTEAERGDIQAHMGGEWRECEVAGGLGWAAPVQGNRLFARYVAQQVVGGDMDDLPKVRVKTTFGKLSPEAQLGLQTMGDSLLESLKNQGAAPWIDLQDDSSITVDTTQHDCLSFMLSGKNTGLGMAIPWSDH